MRSLCARAVTVALLASAACKITPETTPQNPAVKKTPGGGNAEAIDTNGRTMIEQGRNVFRDETFGSEEFWGALGLHRAILGEKNGGVGPGVSPNLAVQVGLKVDQERVPPHIAAGILSGIVKLDDPANTVKLLQANAVVGVRAFFQDDKMVSIGITCALCHSTVDDALAKAIGRRLDGWPNRDLNVGAIVSLAPNSSRSRICWASTRQP